MGVRYMKRKVRLSLDEQLVLLALDDSLGPKAARIRAKWLDLGLAGVILHRLLRRGSVTIADSRISVRGSLALGDISLDPLLAELGAKSGPFKRPRVSVWLKRVVGKNLRLLITGKLVGKGVLRLIDPEFELLMPELREELVQRVRRAVAGGKDADQEMVVLAGLADAAGCLKQVAHSKDLHLDKAGINDLRRRAGPSAMWVRTAVGDHKFRTSMATAIGAIIGSGIVTIVARQCSS